MAAARIFTTTCAPFSPLAFGIAPSRNWQPPKFSARVSTYKACIMGQILPCFALPLKAKLCAMIRQMRLPSLAIIAISVLLCGGIIAAPETAHGAPLADLQAEALKHARDGAAAQTRINKIADETQSLLHEYRAAQKRLSDLGAYNQQVQKLLMAQEAQAQSLRRQIDGVVHIDRKLTPLMLRMVDALAQFIALDIPFLMDERRARIANLRALMARADVSVAEKYRKVLQAYDIENEYGRTLEVYDSTITQDAKTRQVQFLRIGRLALLYQTPDGSHTALWRQTDKGFITWDGDFVALRRAMRIARGLAAPDFFAIPLSVDIKGVDIMGVDIKSTDTKREVP